MECRLEAANRQLAREIEERKLLENALKDSERQLRALNASKDTFFSIIAHDLRNPFNSLVGLTKFLVSAIEDYDKDRLKSFLSRLHTSAEKVYALLNNLLEWSRLERGLLQPALERIELCRLILFVVEAMAADAARKQIALVNRVPKGMVACADPNMLTTVVRNLVANAVKFTESGGTIAISARQTGNVVELDVSDTGIGISADGLNKLFRIDAKYTRKGTADEDGTGLGLLLCKELVEKNGGTIRVESEVGKGSTFTVTLPIDD
jgi:signal transduction histidine kinase